MADGQINTGLPPVKPPTIPKTKVDMIAEIKKLLQKNSLIIDDNSILGFIEKIQTMTTGLSFVINNNKILALDALKPELKPTLDSQDILALPEGRYYVITRNYEGWATFDKKMFKDIIDNYNNPALNKPFIDLDHDSTKSAGMFSNPRIESDGLHVDFNLNEYGLSLVKGGIYNYISPTIIAHKTGTGSSVKNWMATISLTNSPALLGAIPMLSEQLSLSIGKTRKEKTRMENMVLSAQYNKLMELSSKYNAHVSLAAGDLSPDAIAAAFPDIVELIGKLNEAITKLTGQVDTANADAKKATDTANQAVAMSAKLQKEKSDAEFENVIKDALECGAKINEELQDSLRLDYNSDAEKTKKYISALKQSDKKISTYSRTSNAGGDNDISEKDRKIALSAGYDLSKPEDKAKFKQVMAEDESQED